MKNFLAGLAVVFCDLIFQGAAILADVWPHVALANGRLFCKDCDGNMACFESIHPTAAAESPRKQ